MVSKTLTWGNWGGIRLGIFYDIYDIYDVDILYDILYMLDLVKHRNVIIGVIIVVVLVVWLLSGVSKKNIIKKCKKLESSFLTKDGTQIYFKDWNMSCGKPCKGNIIFSHGWPLSSDAFEDQMLFFASRGYRCIAHDRRGHGRSSQPWTGNNMNTYADDLNELIDHLDLRNSAIKIILVGHSTGGGEVVRYIGRHGTKHVLKLILISSVTPLMLKTSTNNNPLGQSIEIFNGIRKETMRDRSQYFKDLSGPFYGANRANNTVSQGLRDSFWLHGMMGGLKSIVACIKAFSETDFRGDLKRINVPTLILHGSDDQIVPVTAATSTSKLIKHAKLKIIEGAPHGMCSTLKNQINNHIFEFIKQ